MNQRRQQVTTAELSQAALAISSVKASECSWELLPVDNHLRSERIPLQDRVDPPWLARWVHGSIPGKELPASVCEQCLLQWISADLLIQNRLHRNGRRNGSLWLKHRKGQQ